MPETVRDEITQLARSIRALERELEAALAKRRVELNYKLHDGIVSFEQVVIAKHRLLKARLLHHIFGARPAMILTAPAIYALIIPVLLLDLFVAVYQTVCFPVYGIARERRSDYLAFDREQLAYLNAIEKLNCAYCAYANGVFAYVRAVTVTPTGRAGASSGGGTSRGADLTGGRHGNRDLYATGMGS